MVLVFVFFCFLFSFVLFCFVLFFDCVMLFLFFVSLFLNNMSEMWWKLGYVFFGGKILVFSVMVVMSFLGSFVLYDLKMMIWWWESSKMLFFLLFVVFLESDVLGKFFFVGLCFIMF